MQYSYGTLLYTLLIMQFLSASASQFSTTANSIPYSTRAHWMRVANQVLSDLNSPCPFLAFGTVIVNHTGHGLNSLGQLICTGMKNMQAVSGNPSMHGEVGAIDNCSSIVTARDGTYGLSPKKALATFTQFSIYTNAEGCPMGTSAIRLARFKEYIYGTSIDTLLKSGFRQIRVTSSEVFMASMDLVSKTKLIPGVLTNETDPLFKWQFNPKYPCPAGCQRTADGTSCVKS